MGDYPFGHPSTEHFDGSDVWTVDGRYWARGPLSEYDLVAEVGVTNDYKNDADKAPVLDALLPFYPALEALARMMVDSAKKHKIEGAEDPFQQWKQLPDAKKRLANAAARHFLKGPWQADAESGHLHATHALFGVLASLTLHLESK